MEWADSLQSFAHGLLIAGLYASVTLGLTLVLGVMGIVNFAHGEKLATLAARAPASRPKISKSWHTLSSRNVPPQALLRRQLRAR